MEIALCENEITELKQLNNKNYNRIMLSGIHLKSKPDRYRESAEQEAYNARISGISLK